MGDNYTECCIVCFDDITEFCKSQALFEKELIFLEQMGEEDGRDLRKNQITVR